MQFPTFLEGFFWIIIASIACSRLVHDRHQLWLWLVVVATARSSGEWLQLLAPGFASESMVSVASSATILSYVATVEFGRQALIRAFPSVKSLPLLFPLFSLSLAAATLTVGGTWIQSALLAGAIPGFAAATIAFGCFFWVGTCAKKFFLLLTTLSLLAQVGLLIAHMLNIASSPLLSIIVLLLFTIALAGAFWEAQQCRNTALQAVVLPRWLLWAAPTGYILIALCSWYGAEWIAGQAFQSVERKAHDESHTLARALNMRQLQHFQYRANDMNLPQFWRACEMLSSYHRVHLGLQQISMVTLRDDQLVSGVASMKRDQQHCDALLGQTAEVDPAARKAWQELHSTEALRKEQKVLTIYTPLLIPSSRQVTALLRTDFDLHQLHRQIFRQQLYLLIPAMGLTLVLAIGTIILTVRRSTGKNQYWIEPTMVLIAGIALSFFATFSTASYDHQHRSTLFQHWGSQKFRQAQNHMLQFAESVSVIEQLVKLPRTINDNEFALLAQSLVNRTGIELLAWAPASTPERNTTTYTIAATSKTLEGRIELGHNPLQTLPIAIDIHQLFRQPLPTMTKPFSLPEQKTPDGWVAILIPVVASEQSPNHGVLLVLMNVPMFWQQALENGLRRNQDVLLDISMPSADGAMQHFPVFDSEVPEGAGSATLINNAGLDDAEFTTYYPLFRYGQSWLFTATPGPLFYQAFPKRPDWIIGAFGLVITLCISLLVLWLTRTNTVVQSEVDKKTAELRQLLAEMQLRIDAAILENRQQDAIIEEQRRRQTLAELLVNLAHQWRQPLSVYGLVLEEILEDFRDETLTIEVLEKRVETALRQITSLSETISQFTEIYQNQDIPMHEFYLKATWDMASKIMKANPVYSIQAECMLEADLSFFGNKGDCIELFTELLRNSDEVARERNRTDVRATMRAWKDGNGELTIVFEDNAGGILSEIFPVVWDPYTTTSFKTPNKGLGLYTLKRVVEERYYGRVYAENTDVGARFTFVFPRPKKQGFVTPNRLQTKNIVEE
ncbi:ATP-binding protein [Chrysiogenes arsenatis]|uniref:ATP-binding protein n=1 Tax=Chrysiogenes arsenatis TaxID=309797 RepID=UPI00041BAC7D|nr:ATP-binding protein [Chrysiogenes arsenatis]